MTEETLEQTFRVPMPARLVLGNIRGSVHIEPGSDGEIAVRAVKQPDTGDTKYTEISMTQAEDGSVKVETRYRELAWFFVRRPCKVDYFLRVPCQCSVKLSGVSNTARLAGLEGDISVASVSGPVELADLRGHLKINSVSGKISAGRLSGALIFETVSGEVSMAECNLTSIEGSTVSGDVSLETPLDGGPYHLNSVSGHAYWRLPGASACTINMDSLSGRLRTTLPVSHSQPERGHGPGGREVAELNGGGVPIAFHSVSGSLHLESQTGETSVEAPAQQAVEESQPEAGGNRPPSKMEILERIERGEMTVEEGLKHLH